MKNIIFSICILAVFSLNAQIDRSKQPLPGAAPEINLGVPQSFELPNGLKVIVVENHKLPRVSYTLTLDNPPVLEGEKAGVSQLMGSLLGKGSKSIEKDAFNEEVDYMGARINFSANGASAAGLSKNSERIMELLADAAINPNFTQEEFKKEQDILLDNLKADEKNVPSAARRVENALAYGINHPYGEYISEETVKNVSLSDVATHYRNYFVPKNAYLAIVGDVDFNKIENQVTDLFGTWKKASPPDISISKPNNVQYTQINFVDMPNAVQSEIAVQNLVDLKMTDPDYFPALLANKVLGGSFRSYLNGSLREDKGYTYGAGSRIGADKYASRFRAAASVRNAVTDSAIVVFIDQLKRIREEKIDSQEMAIAKAEYVGEFVMALESPQTIARFALNIMTENLPEDFYVSYLEKINAVTPEQAQAAAQKYVGINNARIVVTGKGSEILENLEKVTFNGKTIPVFYFDKYAKDVEKPNYEAAIPEGVTVQSIIDKYFEAIGGKDKVAQVTSLKLVFEGSAMGATIKIEEKRTQDKFAQISYMNGSAVGGVVAKGDELFMKQGANNVPLPPDMQKDMLQSLGIFAEQRIAANPAAKVAGTEMVEGKEAIKIEVPGTVVQTTYFYDVETGLKVKEASVTSMNGQTQNQEAFLKDYTEVDGIKFPSVRMSQLGPQMVEFKLMEAVINVEVTDADFE
ncbi:pitrilysin family protein [uncultured Muriicola sp.]|uniref:M16 family metallopeptidase n=1 Tax=uncultured Muriicola sp. TaxID=1583102 RepID=UPI00262DD17C|nr:pitrilysin family protein [uncultured Muriicola sp.]